MQFAWQRGMRLMPVVPKNLHAKCEFNTTLRQRLLSYYCGCHGNLVTIATSYAADAYVPTSIPIMDSIQLKRKEFLTYHCGCHGNLVIIPMRHVADAYRLIEPTSIPNMDSIQLKTKELQNKMYLTRAH